MKTLFLLRHAKSSWDDAATSDHDRGLNDRGKRDAPRVGVMLLESDLVPDVIYCSTAKRAKKTAQAVAKAAKFSGQLVFESDLYASSVEAYLQVAATVDDDFDRLLLVGHNPTMESTIYRLTEQQETMPTAALAVIELEIDQWSDLRLNPSARLVSVWRPKDAS